MNSGIIGKIEKAQRYEHEPERVSIHNLEADFRGEHSVYNVSLSNNHWQCTCNSYSLYGTCSHVMALQKILSQMLSLESRSESPLEHSGAGASEH